MNYIRTIKVSRRELKQSFFLVTVVKMDMKPIAFIYKCNE